MEPDGQDGQDGQKGQKGGSGPTLRSRDPAAASEGGRLLGSISTEKKAAAARRNQALRRTYGGPQRKDALGLACTCGAGTEAVETLPGQRHKTTCPRGKLLYKREQNEARKRARETKEGQS